MYHPLAHWQRDRHDQADDGGAWGKDRRDEDACLSRDTVNRHRFLPDDGRRGDVEEAQRYPCPAGHGFHRGQRRRLMIRRRDRCGRELDRDRDRTTRRCRPRCRVPRGRHRRGQGCPRIGHAVKKGMPRSVSSGFQWLPTGTAAQANIRQCYERSSANAARQYLAATEPRAVVASSSGAGCAVPPQRTHNPVFLTNFAETKDHEADRKAGLPLAPQPRVISAKLRNAVQP